MNNINMKYQRSFSKIFVRNEQRFIMWNCMQYFFLNCTLNDHLETMLVRKYLTVSLEQEHFVLPLLVYCLWLIINLKCYKMLATFFLICWIPTVYSVHHITRRGRQTPFYLPLNLFFFSLDLLAQTFSNHRKVEEYWF